MLLCNEKPGKLHNCSTAVCTPKLMKICSSSGVNSGAKLRRIALKGWYFTGNAAFVKVHHQREEPENTPDHLEWLRGGLWGRVIQKTVTVTSGRTKQNCEAAARSGSVSDCVSPVKMLLLAEWLCGAEWRAPAKSSLHISFKRLQRSVTTATGYYWRVNDTSWWLIIGASLGLGCTCCLFLLFNSCSTAAVHWNLFD